MRYVKVRTFLTKIGGLPNSNWLAKRHTFRTRAIMKAGVRQLIEAKCD